MQYVKQSEKGKFILKAYRNEGYFCDYGKYWEFYPSGENRLAPVISSRGDNQ